MLSSILIFSYSHKTNTKVLFFKYILSRLEKQEKHYDIYMDAIFFIEYLSIYQ